MWHGVVGAACDVALWTEGRHSWWRRVAAGRHSVAAWRDMGMAAAGRQAGRQNRRRALARGRQAASSCCSLLPPSCSACVPAYFSTCWLVHLLYLTVLSLFSGMCPPISSGYMVLLYFCQPQTPASCTYLYISSQPLLIRLSACACLLLCPMLSSSSTTLLFTIYTSLCLTISSGSSSLPSHSCAGLLSSLLSPSQRLSLFFYHAPVSYAALPFIFTSNQNVVDIILKSPVVTPIS